MTPDQFGEVLRLLLILSVLSGLFGAVLWRLIESLIFVVIDLLQRRMERKVGGHG